MMRICHMSSAHRGLDIRIFVKECASLAAAGYETHLVITAPVEVIEKAAAQKVILHALPLPTRRMTRMFKQAWRCYRTANALSADVYHFHDPELIPYGMLLRLAGKRVIYDVHEDLPRDILDKEWIPMWARRLVSFSAEVLEYTGARWFFSIVAATPFIAKRFGRITQKSIDINNYPNPDELIPIAVGSARSTKVCYLGGISRIRGLKVVIEALPLTPEVTLVLCGQFLEPEFEAELKGLPGWKQVDYRGQVDRAEVRRVLSESCAGIVTLLPTRAYLDSLPIKMFEYMSAGIPVIASNFPLWRQIIDDAQAGIYVDPSSPEAIASALREMTNNPGLAERMGRAGRKAVLEKYNWHIEAKKLVNFYEALQ